MAKRRASRSKSRTRKPLRRARSRTKGRRATVSKHAGLRAREAAPDVAIPANWDYDMGGKAISVELTTKDFLAAVSLVNDIARLAEELEHHPDLHVTGWNHLKITTYSHDVGRLTSRDERLAARINDLLRARGLGG